MPINTFIPLHVDRDASWPLSLIMFNVVWRLASCTVHVYSAPQYQKKYIQIHTEIYANCNKKYSVIFCRF